MEKAGSEDDRDGGADRTPLLPLSEQTAAPAAPHRRQSRPVMIVIALVMVMLLATHFSFVLLLRKTTFELRRLTVPDMCHEQSGGGIIVAFDNPSYCSPQVGHVQLTISKNATELLHLSLPAFELASGKSTLVSTLSVKILASPEVVHELVFQQSGNYSLAGDVVVHISCLLIPFSITLDLSDLTAQEKHKRPLQRLQALDGNVIRQELDKLVSQILKTIALSHIHTESDDDVLFAFTDVTFSYVATVLWNLPSLAVKLQTDDKKTVLQAGFKRFLLGNGDTFISGFSEIYKNETGPLQSMLQKYLSGTDVGLHVSGANPDSPCLSLQLLDLLDVRVNVPATIDGQPALLRYYVVAPMLKELDSKTHTCLLELDVSITLHNPLPIHFELFELAFDLLYHNSKDATSTPRLLTHIDDRRGVAWRAHDTRNVSLSTEIRDFDVCKDLVKIYLQDELAFSLTEGRIHMAAGTGNFTIPFHVDEIPIHPSAMVTELVSWS